MDPAKSIISELIPDQNEEIGYLVSNDRRRFEFEIPYGEARIEAWKESPPDFERHPDAYPDYDFACWILDAFEGITSDWIFRRPYKWAEGIKPGWNPPFGRPTFVTPEDAALVAMNREVVSVASVNVRGKGRVDVTLEARDDPGKHFPMTFTCVQLPNGRWRRSRD